MSQAEKASASMRQQQKQQQLQRQREEVASAAAGTEPPVRLKSLATERSRSTTTTTISSSSSSGSPSSHKRGSPRSRGPRPLQALQALRDRLSRWTQGVGSVLVAAGWGEVGAVVPDVRQLRLLRSQMRLVLKQLPLIERAGIGALAGGLAGGFTNATLHPIDTVKTRLQARGADSLYSGPMDVVQKLSASQGVAGFYRGLPAAIVGSFVSSAIYFGTYELSKGFLSRPLSLSLPFDPLSLGGRRIHAGHAGPVGPGGEGAYDAGSHQQNQHQQQQLRQWRLRIPPLLIPPLSAALGNVASSAILVPKELIKQRLQAGAAGTTWQVLKQTLRDEGLQGLYTGYSAALMRNLPTNVLNFSFFEYLKAGVLASAATAGHATVLKPWQSMLCGAAAGLTSSALTTPLDVVKTRLMTEARAAVATRGHLSLAQVEAAAKAQAAASYTYGGVAHSLQTIFQEEGAKGLLRGMGPRVLYGACFSAVGFFSYEAARVFLLRMHLERKMPHVWHQFQDPEQPPSPAMVSRGLGH